MVNKMSASLAASARTPYELRFDLLAMARDTLEAEYHSKMEEARWAHEMSGGIPQTMPSYPTRDDVFKLAEQLKEFVERK